MIAYYRAPKIKTPTNDERREARQDAFSYLARRRLHAGRPSSLRKLRKAQRIADMVRPLTFTRTDKKGNHSFVGAYGWQEGRSANAA